MIGCAHTRGHFLAYSTVYDAEYCVTCNEWLEPLCTEPDDCDYCSGRPDKPIGGCDE